VRPRRLALQPWVFLEGTRQNLALQSQDLRTEPCLLGAQSAETMDFRCVNPCLNMRGVSPMVSQWRRHSSSSSLRTVANTNRRSERNGRIALSKVIVELVGKDFDSRVIGRVAKSID
jgi:hypothetical protein